MSTLALTTSRIGNYYNQSKTSISKSLELLSSGIKYRTPSDGVGEFMTVERLKQDDRGYTQIQRGLKRTQAIVNTAEQVGEQIVNEFARLKELTYDYWSAPAGSDDRTRIETEFNTSAANITTLMDSAYAGGKDLIQNGTVTSALLNPNDLSQTMDIAYTAGDIADASVLTVNGGADYDASIAAINVESQKAMSYLAKTSGYSHSLASQIKVTDSIMENSAAMVSTLNNIDDAEEMSNYVTQDIRSQASISMLSQANMLRSSVLRLFD